MKRALVFLLFLVFPLLTMAATITVPVDQPTIQAGIDAAVDGDTVLVAPGTYVENINFLGKAITVQSEQGPEVTIIDGSSPPDPDLGSVVTFESGEGPDSVLEGFTVTNGTGTRWAAEIYYGGGIFVTAVSSPTITANIITGNSCPGVSSAGGGIMIWMSSSPTVTGNTIEDNDASIGGGLYCYNSSALITYNTLVGNSANIDGGGLFFQQGRAEITHCSIIDNSADNSCGGIGATYCSLTVEDCTITGNYAASWGGGIGANSDLDRTLTVRRCSIQDNSSGMSAGGVFGQTMIMMISDNVVSGNWALAQSGGGIYAYGGCEGIITNNIVYGNHAAVDGGGIALFINCTMDIINNLVFDNEVPSTGSQGGGIWCSNHSTALVKNSTIYGNSACTNGGGISCDNGSVMTIQNTILWENEAGTLADEIFIGSAGNPSTVTIDYSDVKGGQDSILVHPNCILEWGEGMITDDPEFCEGPPPEDCCQYYLANEACGDPADSPCLEAGNPMSQLVQGTTRTDLEQDWDVVDMGFHYPREVQAFVTAGPGPGYENQPLVRIFPPEQDAEQIFEFSAYGALNYGVNVSTGDVNANQMNEIITGAAPGEIYGPHVRGFQADGFQLPGLSFLAYGTNKYGVNVAAGDIDGDGYDEIITGAGPGAVFGPHVRGWDYDGTGEVTAIPGVSFFAYGTPKWGVTVACGDIDGDGYDEIVTGAGPGAVYGPHVRGWDYDGAPPVTPVPGCSFFAYGTLKYGVNVSCGDVDGDGIDEIVTGAGPGAVFGPHVRGWKYDGETVTPLPGFSFFAWDDSVNGVNVFAGADLDGDGRDELVAGRGPDLTADTEVKVFTYDGATVALWFSLEAFEGMTHGANVAAGRF